MGKIRADYHMHSISPDARVPLEDLCEAALERGLDEIAVTDHFEFFSPDYEGKETALFREDYLDRYFAEYERVAPAYEGRLAVRRAMECGQPLCDPEYARRIFQQYRFDYVIGSVHKLFNVDLAFKRYAGNTIEGLARTNLEMLYDLADRGDFDCLGHVDLIKRYAARQGQRVGLLQWPDEVGAVLRRLAERGKGLEINTSGLRQGLGETLPGLDILKLYRSLGGEILTVGSDAHRACDVGAGFGEARELALAAGFTRLAVYEERRCSFYPIA